MIEKFFLSLATDTGIQANVSRQYNGCINDISTTPCLDAFLYSEYRPN